MQALRETFRDRKALKQTDQILPAYGEGSLDQPFLDAVKRNYIPLKVNSTYTEAIRVYLLRLPDSELFKQAVRTVFPNAEFYDSNEKTLPNWGDDDSDLILSGPDMGFVEDISLYSYAVKAGIFRTSENSDHWLSEYMKVMQRESRIALIRKIHAYNLENGFAFPCFASPYVALARKPWVITLPKLFANHPLWQIQFQP